MLWQGVNSAVKIFITYDKKCLFRAFHSFHILMFRSEVGKADGQVRIDFNETVVLKF